MRVRRPWLLMVALLIPGAASADDHRADIFAAAFSSVHGSLLLGPHVAFGKSLPESVPAWFNVVGEFSTHFGPDEETGKRVAYAVGGRVSYPTLTHHKLVHSGRVLVGSVYGTERGEGDKDFSGVFGYEAEYIPTRTDDPYEGWAFRAQIDYVVRQGDSKNFVRFSTGVVYRWKHD
jgi:hypothetical protein